ncbi:MAG: DMT family transporter [Gammaproteobacteria bacterium]|nr:DMT family transporter [Gammaproteobacteria bacterium]
MHRDSPSKHSATVLPVFSLLITAILWGVAWYPLRVAENHGLPGLWTTLIVFGVAMIVGLMLFWRQLPEIRQQPSLLIVLAIMNGWLNVAFVLAVIDGNVVRVILLFYLSPVWSTLLGWWLLDEKLSGLSIVTLVVAMLGAIIMLWDPSLGFPWPQDFYDWLAITSGMAFSISNVIIRKLQRISIRAKSMTAWIGVTVVATVWILATDHALPAAEGHVFFWTMLIGVVMVFIVTFAVQYGVMHMPVYLSAIILLFELVAGAISSQLLSDEVIGMAEWLGGGMIMLAAYLSARSLMHSSNTSS